MWAWLEFRRVLFPSGHIPHRIAEQVGAPDANMFPTEPAKLLDAQPVAIPSARHRGIPRAVGLDCHHDPTVTLWVLDSEVEALSGCAVAGMHHQALGSQPERQVGDQRIQLGTWRHGVPFTIGCAQRVRVEWGLRGRLDAALCGIQKEVTQHEGTTGLEPGRIEVSRSEGGDDGHPAPSASDRDVESTLATLEVEWPKTVQHPAVGGLSIADREDDGVALVALDPLQVLDEEPLGTALVEEVADADAVGQGAAQGVLDPGRMLDAQRNNPQRLARTC